MRDCLIKIKISLLNIIVLMMFSNCLYGQGSNDSYQQAYRLFDSGNYQQALESFQILLADDRQNAVLIYDIGLCYQSLENYEQADRYFSQILSDPELGDWATYQLAMQDWKQGFLGAAEIGLTQVVFNSNDADLVELATLRYQDLINQMSAVAANRQSIYGSIGLAYGVDDNIVDSRFQNASNQEDNFVELSGSISKDWQDDLGRMSWQWRGFVFLNRYDVVDSADIGLYNTGVDKYFYGGDWQFALGLELEQSNSGGDEYLGVTAFNFSARSNYLNAYSGWLINLRYADARALSAEFDQLAGTTEEIDIDYRIPLSDVVVWRLGVSISEDSRDPISTANFQSDLSADRQGISTSVIALLNRWRLAFDLDYRNSDYGNILRIGNNFRVNRDDERTRLSLRADYELNNHFSFYAEAISIDNDSNVALFKYEQTTLSAGLLWGF